MKKHLNLEKYNEDRVEEEFKNLIETVNYYFFTEFGHKDNVNIHELLDTCKLLHKHKEYVRVNGNRWKDEVEKESQGL